MSFESFVAGLAGDGDVARKSIRFAASLSVGAGRGVVCCCGRDPPGGGGVWVRFSGSAARLELDGIAVVAVGPAFRADDCVKCA